MSSSPASLDLEAQSEKDTYVAHVTLELDDHDRPRSPSAPHATAEVAPRLTSEFRTLSIHVETRTSPEEPRSGVSGAIRSKAVKGTAHDVPYTRGAMCSPPRP